MIKNLIKRITGGELAEKQGQRIDDMYHVKTMCQTIMDAVENKDYQLAFFAAEELNGFADANIMTENMLLSLSKHIY